MAQARKGKHPDKALTAVKIRNLKKPGRYADGGGLYLVVDETRAKRWSFRAVIQKGKRSEIGLGGLKTVSLAEAREEAHKLRRLVRTGGNPLEQKRAAKRAIETPTFEAAARSVHESLAPGFRNAKHAAQWLNTVEVYAVPFFGSKRVDQIESADVLKALSPIWIKKPETARRVKMRVRAILEWAKAAGYRKGDNPTEGLTEVLPDHNRTHKHHAALPYAQVPEFLRILRASKGGDSVKLAFEFLILTASRTSEVLKAQWREFNLEAATWTVPAERMKGKVEHHVPLSSRGLEILKAAEKISDGGPYAFPGDSAKSHLSDMSFIMCLRRMGKTGCTPHGFRSSFRDWAAEQTQFQREVIEAALAHKLEDKTEASYFRSDLREKRRELLKIWTHFCLDKS